LRLFEEGLIMLTRQSPFGRMPGFGIVAICSLAAGWGAGYHSRFVTISKEELPAYSPPYALDPLATEPAFPGLEAHFAQRGDAKARPEAAVPAAPAPEVTAQVHVTQQEHDLTGFSEALASYKSGGLAQGDLAAAAAQDKTVKTALEWIALRSSPHEAGFDRLQAFMQAHPTWPALEWLKKRSEESLFGDRKSNAIIKTYFGSAMPATPAGKLALARALV